MRTYITALVAGAFLVWGEATSARDLYVNNVIGNDSLSGRQERPNEREGPVRTICRVLRLAQPGDHIHLAKTDRPYREQVSISGPRLRGTAYRPFIISGNGAVLDGTVIAEAGAWQHEQGDVFSLRPRRLTFQQIFRGNTPAKRVRLASYTDLEEQLQPLEWALVSDRMLFRVAPGQLPSSYRLRHAGLQTGITLYNTEHVRIENLVVQGYQQDGINAHEMVRLCELDGVECRANGRSGVSVGGVSRVLIQNSNLYDNGVAQLRLEGQARVRLDNSDVAASPDAPAYEILSGQLTINGKPYEAQ